MVYRDAGAQERETDRDSAVARVCRAARRYLITEPALRASVLQVEAQPELYSRILYTIERRRVVPVTEPAYGSRPSDVCPLPAIPADPWSVDPDTIASTSRTIATCPDCYGEKRVDCRRCRGSSRVGCGHCGGGGRVLGKRGTRSCPSCRGSGTVKCPECRGGRVDCGTCAKLGWVVAFLTVRWEELRQVRVRGTGSGARVHPSLDRWEDFDTLPSRWPNPLLRDTGTVGPDAVGADGPDLLPTLNAVHDRLRTARRQDFEARVHRVAFATLLGHGYADVVGNPPEVGNADWRPFARRRVLAVAGVLAGFIATVIGVASYRAEHPFHAIYGPSATLAALGCAASIAGGLATLGLLLRPRAWGWLRTITPTILVVALLFAWPLAERSAGPTADGANAALARGELDRAGIEASALIDLGLDRLAGARVLDELHRLRLEGASGPGERATILRQRWHSRARYRSARRTFEAECARSAAQAYAASDERRLATLEGACGWLGDTSARDIQGRLALLRFASAARAELHSQAEAGLARLQELRVPEASWRPVLVEYERALGTSIARELDAERSASSAEDRANHLVRALALAERLERVSGEPSRPSTTELRSRHGRARAEADRVATAAEERQRRDEARRARAAARRERAWASSPLRCCDGSRSPSCRCGDGSHRGCCSHHGGVCGCSAD